MSTKFTKCCEILLSRPRFDRPTKRWCPFVEWNDLHNYGRSWKTFRSWYGLIDSIWLCVCLRQTLSKLSVFNNFVCCSWLLCALRTISESSVNCSQLTAKVFCLLYLKFIVLLTTSFLIVINSITMNGNLSWPIASVIFRLTKLLLKNVSGFKFRPSNWLKSILRTRYIFQ